MQLSKVSIGSKVLITDLSSTNTLIQKRLMDFGIDEGSEICLLQKLPFQGPCMIECAGQCISLRQKEACQIGVKQL